MANPTDQRRTPPMNAMKNNLALQPSHVATSAKPQGNQYDLTRMWNAIPFVMPPNVSYKRNTKMGRGMICPVTVGATTTIVVRHNLGRVAVGAHCLANGPNNTLFPAFIMFPSKGTAYSQAIQASAALSSALVWFF